MALYPPAIKKLIPPGPTDPRIKARVLILHVAVSEQPSLHDYFNGPSGGVESHFYVRRDGTVEQYRDTAWQADANTDANDFALSVETQGMEYGEWTPQQVESLKALILWGHKTHGIPLAKCKTWNGSGVGYHTQFEGTWDKRGATCPGPDRIKQFNNVLVPWLATGGQDDDMTPDQSADLERTKTLAESNSVRLQTRVEPGLAAIQKALRELAAAIPGIPEATAQKVLADLTVDYDAEITLTKKDA